MAGVEGWEARRWARVRSGGGVARVGFGAVWARRREWGCGLLGRGSEGEERGRCRICSVAFLGRENPRYRLVRQCVPAWATRVHIASLKVKGD